MLEQYSSSSSCSLFSGLFVVFACAYEAPLGGGNFYLTAFSHFTDRQSQAGSRAAFKFSCKHGPANLLGGRKMK